MGKIKVFLKEKSVGFYFILASLVLSLIAIILFFANLGGDKFISWTNFALLLVLLLGSIALIIFKKDAFVPALTSILSGLVLGFFIYDTYNYIAIVMTGIDIESFAPIYIAECIFLVLLFGISIASIFIPINKSSKEGITNEQKA